MNLVVPCPAKINLFLSVGPLDGSGFHPIRTVFQAVSLFDTLGIKSADTDSFQCDDPSIPADNTVTKAWRLAREYVDLPTASVTLWKKIPQKSGLGGGSSDAAGLLRWLVRATDGRFSEREAMEVAAAVGSDVPFFLVGGRTRGEGYGQVLTPLDDEPGNWLVIVMPKAAVCTKGAYAELDRQPRVLKEFPPDPATVDNDFLSAAPVQSVAAIERLKHLGAKSVGLTGSGAAVFGFCDSEVQAMAIADTQDPEWQSAWACHTLTRKESLWTS